ncbi:C40 family peptidase [Mucilaginibacter phyllosphaerae]|nr:NlpC/P60 family protein [Mucilaginibacter phyllosphaerae]MBB3969256.1 lipoprotein Spr/probable lipoprotein NlpC [Mucilaginibacter phyllosphaerae]
MMRNGSNDPYTMTKPDKDIAEKYAALMGVNRSEIQNGRLYDFIEEWYGTTYRFGGLDKNGVDCSGLTFLLQQQVYGITLPRMTSKQVLVIKRKYEEELKEGDLVFFDFDGKQFSHVGVYLQNGYFVHASTRKGVMIARLHDNGIYKFFSRGGSITDSTSSAQTE